MLDLVKEIERLTNNNQEKEDHVLKTKKELSLSQSQIESLNENVKQLSEKVQQAEAALSDTKKDAVEKINHLQSELDKISQEKSESEKVL